jgi:hypothetical protein
VTTAAEAFAGIAQTLYRYARAMDRMDADLALQCFAPDAHIYYGGKFDGTPAEFVRWLWPLHAGMVGHTHSISNILVEHDDRRTASEAYVMTTLRMRTAPEEQVDYVSRGRYLDIWEPVETRWRIIDRLYVTDLNTVSPVGVRDVSALLPLVDIPLVPSRRDTTDASYARLSGSG